MSELSPAVTDPTTQEMLDELGLALENGRVTLVDLHQAETAYIHHTRVPVAMAGYTLVSPAFARGRFPKSTFIGLIQVRPAMDADEAKAFADVCGATVTPPFWGNPGPFGTHLWAVIAKYQLEPFFERVEQRLSPSQGEHYLMRPRGFNWLGDWEPNPSVLSRWRADYRKLDTAHQLMVATILQLYRSGDDPYWMVRVPKGWHASEGVQILQDAGYLADWAKLVALYPGW